MSSYGLFLLYCFTSGVAYYGFFRERLTTRAYWLGLLGLAVFNVLLGVVLKVK